jgi:hypothetical protein
MTGNLPISVVGTQGDINMSKRNFVFMVALLAVSVALVGCGGGGGGVADNNTPPITDTSRILTGSVISSTNGKGVKDVVVRLVSLNLFGKTAADGTFSIKVPANTGLPVHLYVDTSLVAGAYPAGNVVQYNGMQYDPTMVDIPIGVLNEASNTIGTITVFDYSGDTAPPPPYSEKATIIYGRVVSGKTGLGVPGVNIKLSGATGEPTYPVVTGKAGYYAIDLGLDKKVTDFYPSTKVKFTPTLGTAASLFPATAMIQYKSAIYLPGVLVAVTAEVIAGETNDMGTIKVLDEGTATGGGDDDGENPPPPPI